MIQINCRHVFIICAFLFGPWGADNNRTAFADEPATRKLFNGKDLDGFYTYLKGRGKGIDPSGVFTVQDGILRISGAEWGCLTTEAEYENYHLIVEFKWGEMTHDPRKSNARDSGVLLHSIAPDGAYNGTWMHSIECQIIEGGTGDIIVVGDRSDSFAVTSPVSTGQTNGAHVYAPDGTPITIHGGRIDWFGRAPGWEDVKGFRGPNDVEKPVGEWNRLECIADGDEITVILNGKVVNRAVKVQPRKGKIQIQSEGAEIFFRRVDMMALGSD